MSEERNSHRVDFNALVEFETDESQLVCDLYDISLQGALIGACSGATPDAGTNCKLIIKLDDDGETRIVMNGSVAHKIENRVGIHCDEIDELSMTHLRKLVEYNLGDVELVNRDFDALSHEQ